MRLSLFLAAFSLCAAQLYGQTVLTFEEQGRRHSYRVEETAAKSATRTPVLYDLDELPAAAKLAAMGAQQRERRMRDARRLFTEKLHVRLSGESQWEALQATNPVSRRASTMEGWTVVAYKDGNAALAAARWMQKRGGFAFTPVLARQMAKKQAGTLQRPVNDPLYTKQWHLSSENGVSVKGSWDVATGKGINVTVIDDGLDVKHEDLVGNTYPVESGYHFNFNEGPDEDPTPPDLKKDNHGTSCAGLVGARGFNNLGVIGVAPEVKMMGLRLIAGPNDDDATALAFLWQPDGVVTHVSSNSWGPEDDGASAGRMSELPYAALQRAASSYRNGRGTVFVFSAGNGREAGDDSSYDQFSGNRFVIGVGAVNKNNEPSSFSEQGMNVAVSAMGGEMAPPEMVWTTNNSGADALAVLKGEHETSEAVENYSDAFNGTSAAAPQVSGAAALLLERNPRLGYRDVKEILMKTARRAGLQNGDPFVRNGGGFTFSHSFGAGVIDVAAALTEAENWTNLGPLVSVSRTVSGEALIGDGSDGGATATLDFRDAPNLRIEHVELTVDIAHGNRGDLGIGIVAPSGMVSVADPRKADEGENFENYTFTSVRHWGENSDGVWRVRVLDTEKNGVDGALLKVTLRFYGTER